MIPVVALVGRTNVGKSTLFNCLTRSRNALVGNMPGLTRDRQYGQVEHNKRQFIVIDTGGIGVEDLSIDALMYKQSCIALDEASVIFFLVDAKEGLTAADREIAQQLRKLSKPIYVVVNKTESLDKLLCCAEFQLLGFSSILMISAAHGQGIIDLLNQLGNDFVFPNIATTATTDVHETHAIKIACVGRPNVGKSTLINRLLGEERVIVYDMPGTTRDSVSIPFTRNNRAFTLIDTAGVRRRSRIGEKLEKFSVIKTLQSIKESQVCLMLLDAQQGLVEQDLQLLHFIIEAGKALVIAVNKWDKLEKEHKDKIKAALEYRAKFAQFAKIKFISALYGSGVGLLLDDIEQAYEKAIQIFSTPKLTTLLQLIVAQHSPPLIRGRRIKLKYVHIGGHNPPLLVIHGNQLESLPESYKRYLATAFANHLELVGTPLKLEFKSSTNPYKHRKNQLRARQIKKRKRLISHAKKRN